MRSIDKTALLESLKTQVRAELDGITASHRRTTAGATHDEARPENDKDTRALEATYLARGLARRAEQLAQGLALLERLTLRVFGDDDPLALGALAKIEDAGDARVYFIAPAGAGMKLDAGGRQITVLTSSSPLGRLLIGKRLDDEFEFKSPQGVRELCVLALA